MPARDPDGYDRIRDRQDARELERKYGEDEAYETDPDEQRDAEIQAEDWPEIPTLEPLDCEVVKINLAAFKE